MSENFNEVSGAERTMHFYGFGRRLDVIDSNAKHIKKYLNDLTSRFSEALRESLIECGIPEKELKDAIDTSQLVYCAIKKGIMMVMMEHEYVNMFMPNKITEQAYQEFKTVVQEMEEKENNSQKDNFITSIAVYESKGIYGIHNEDIEEFVREAGVLGDKSMGEKR